MPGTLASKAKAERQRAEQLKLTGNHLYYNLMGYFYTDVDNDTALNHFKTAMKLAKSVSDKKAIEKSIGKLTR